ncbi:microtubule-associated protein futsch-like isoform X3 [Physella acuta]|uniref:microtubule-associated protein futsch-like isoform X3 n=1 Tax=Physella acuta TaxID=109671 RepID=UPI0027DB0AA2|nr:microtubule-associated protein futsch-like isoform X3 [Physella acuta]
MAQSETFDPRVEVLTASRHRSGSTKMENNLAPLPPLVTDNKSSSQFLNLRTHFEEKGTGQNSRLSSSLFGPNVSKIKERFQQNIAHKGEDGNGEAYHSAAHSHILSHSLPARATESGDHSPEIKKQKVTEPHAHSMAPALNPNRRSFVSDAPPAATSHFHHPVFTPPLSPTHSMSHAHKNSSTTSSSQSNSLQDPKRKKSDSLCSSRDTENQISLSEPTLLEATNHVQRFNYTRALFARLEEENRKTQEKEKVMRRKLSPSRFMSGTSSPLLSPTSVSPSQESRKFPSSYKDQQQESRRSKSLPDVTTASSNEPMASKSSESFKRYRDLDKTEEHKTETKRSQFASTLSQSLEQQKHVGVEPSQEDPLLRPKPSPTRGSLKRDDSADRSGKYYKNIDPFKALTEDLDRITPDSEEKASEKCTAEKLSGDNVNDLSAELPSSLPALPHSSRLEHSSRPTQHLRSQATVPGLSTSHSKTTSDNQSASSTATSPTASTAGVVRRQRRKLSEQTQGEEATKRLSKEEIEAAIERADSYLANLSPPADKPETADRESRRSLTHAESAAARRKFLYGDNETPSDKDELAEKNVDAPLAQTVLEPVISESKSIELSSVLSSSPSSVKAPLSPNTNSVHVDHGSSPSAVNDIDMEITPDLPPPSYHETADPPPYHEATSTSSMLISQKVIMFQQQQQSSGTDSLGRPVPVPRRAAPPPPQKPANGTMIVSDTAVPPPAPEPGSVEYIRELDSIVGRRTGIILDSDIADDLILPEEHIARHQEEEDLENGNVDVTTSFTKKDFHIARESGDGKEDSSEVLPDGEPLEIDYSKLTFIEIPPIESEEEDESSGDEIEYHKPSRVCFSRSPIKVFATYSTNDYDRRNEDVDPVAASAEYELEKRVEKMDVFPVDLLKGSEGLGLSIIGMGVGADAGLEKLGIFIKTLTPNGAAQKSNQIQVNDQIIEVDGKSLVGVTQAYAASVLRNTSGIVKFLIGREKDPSKSEVARLIQQSLEQDRRREEMREREQQRLKQLEDSFQVRQPPKDEVLERHAHAHQQQLLLRQTSETADDESSSEAGTDEKGIEDTQESEPPVVNGDHDYMMAEQERLEQENAAGDTTPQSVPSNGEDGLDSSPDNSVSTSVAAVVSLAMSELEDNQQLSSSGSASPDMEHEKLFIKLKEGQYKLGVAEAEIVKLKAKILVLEGAEVQKKGLEKKVEELTRKFQERDKHFDMLKKELSQYKDMMVASQSQHIELERKVKELGALEKKYHKAKKLIKDYQQREKDFIQERESLFEQQAEKDQQYNSLVKSLKDRIFTLEKDLTEAQKVAGLPQALPSLDEVDMPASYSKPVPLVMATLNGLGEEPLSPLNQSTEDVLEISTSSETSDPAATPDEADSSFDKIPSLSSSPADKINFHHSPYGVTEEYFQSEFDKLNSSPLLDSSANRDKASLGTAGSLAGRRPPSKKGKSYDAEDDQDSESVKSEITENGSIHSSQTDHAESGLDMWNKHDSDSTVRKSELKKRKQLQQPDKPLPPPPSPPVPLKTGPALRPPVAPKPKKPDHLSTPELSRDDTQSDTSSSVSQTSYDPSRPNDRVSELPDSVAEDSDGGGVALLSAKPTASAKGFSFPKFNWKSSKSRDNDTGGGVILLANRSLVSQHSQSDPGLDSVGITLVSKKRIDTGYWDYDVSSINSDITTSTMVSEPDVERSGRFTLNISGPATVEENTAASKSNQSQSSSVTDWNTEHVSNWLTSLDLDRYSSAFRDKSITGSQLLLLDSSKMKSMGVTVTKDRDLLKKKIKELKANVEREKKQQEKERKLKEKEQKRMSKKK